MKEISLLEKKYGANSSELTRNNLYVHGTTMQNLFGTRRNRGGILETGLKNGVSVSQDTLARNVLYASDVRYGGSGIDGVLIFYSPPKGYLSHDSGNFPSRTTRIDSRAGNYTETLGPEHIAFWLETTNSGISKYIKDTLAEMLKNISTNVDVIGEYVDELAQLITQHALVPNISSTTKFAENNIGQTHHGLDLSFATTYACEILWNSFSEKLFFNIDNLDFITGQLVTKINNQKETDRLIRMLTNQENKSGHYNEISRYVTDFTKLWKQLKEIQLPYDILQEALNRRINQFRTQVLEVENWLVEVSRSVEAYQLQQIETQSGKKPLRTRLNQLLDSVFKP